MEDVKIRKVKENTFDGKENKFIQKKKDFFKTIFLTIRRMRILTLDITHLLAHYNIKTYKEQNSFNEDLC